ncbi:hypothetical protein JAAARDRAFT_59007 [Jaapia argillacea MUCL 33604]|uniref:WW domain-containing protein n=1 Tax=Jaapia argillacea MUCL 33604 TaxID=933084 RepID=A0A067PPL2_9AGAM|nr:hypothetical protein JAAARDRAFT_59007 [Jaapia argillacea MUCL 33604]
MSSRSPSPTREDSEEDVKTPVETPLNGAEAQSGSDSGDAQDEGSEETLAPASSSSALAATPDASATDTAPTTAEAEGDTASASASGNQLTPGEPNEWQAIFSPAHNAYYFYNLRTHVTTWENPLLPQPSASSTPDQQPQPGSSSSQSTALTPNPATAHLYALQEAAVAQGIDPSLAYLDPSLASSSSAPSASTSQMFSAKFNARTGAFTKPDARDPSHLGEYERMKRMSEVYFDVNAWEKERMGQAVEDGEGEEEGEGRKRKRPTKKDLERFKEQKRLKKIAKTAWLRT